jgi:hypothetical protein
MESEFHRVSWCNADHDLAFPHHEWRPGPVPAKVTIFVT